MKIKIKEKNGRCVWIKENRNPSLEDSVELIKKSKQAHSMYYI